MNLMAQSLKKMLSSMYANLTMHCNDVLSDNHYISVMTEMNYESECSCICVLGVE
jgi:hypothetical protein